MNRVITGLLIASAVLLGADTLAGPNCAGGACAAQAQGPGKQAAKVEAKATHIDTATLAALLNAGTDVVVLDARYAQFGKDAQYIPGAKALTSKATAEEAEKVIGGKNRLVVTYCASVKCPASKRLATHLQKLGYSNVLEYPEGIQGWSEAGHELKKG